MAQQMEHKTFAFELSALEGRTVEGYASVFNVKDLGGDRVMPGAFRKTLSERGQKVRFLWQHDRTEPIGRVLELREDDRGLFIKAAVSDTTRGRDCLALLRDKAIEGLSIGYDAIPGGTEYVKEQDGSTARLLKELKLYEVSLATFPMCEAATVTALKAAAGPTEFKPYRAVQRGDKWQVYKLDADDEPEGESLGEHDTEEEAMAQVRALYANEPDAEKARGEGQGVGGPRQGDGGADVCVCPKCGAEAPHEKGVPCAEQECPECGTLMEGKDVGEKAAAVTKSESDGDHPAGHYLVVENPFKPSTWHLRVRGMDGKPDHGLMGAAFAALTVGYRGNVYEGPQKAEAMKKLRALYASEDMETPKEGEGPADEKEITPEGPVKRLGDVLQGSIHSIFTSLCDGWYTDGLLSREERIQLSSLIGDLLDGLTSGMPLDVATRRLSGWGIGYGRMGADGPEEEKIGRVLSSRNVGRIRAAIDAAQSALDALEEMLESAGIGEPAEPEGPEETTSAPTKAADDGHNETQAGPDLASPNPPTWNGTERERLLKRVQLLRASLPLEV